MGVTVRRWAVVWIAVGLTLLTAESSLLYAEAPAAAVAAPVQRSEEELLLFEVRLGRSILSEAIVAYPGTGGGILLPLAELSDLLEFAIEVDVSAGRASGWVLEPSRTFTLDVPARRVVIAGTESSFDERLVELHQDEIFVDSSLLSSWWPVDFRVELSVLVLYVEPRERLPIQMREERAYERARLDSRKERDEDDVPLVRVPWSQFAGPFIDTQLRLRLFDDGAATEFEGHQSTHLSAEVLGHSANFFSSGQHDDPFGDVRASLGRTDLDGGLLGIGATEYRLGEVFVPGDALTIPGGAGPGFLVTNRPLDQQSEATSNTFRGELPAGWEVELFRNDALIAYQVSRGDGLYEFRDVPLQSGLNMFRLVFYGPRGEVREELVTYSIAESIPEPGEWRYRVAGADVRSFDDRGMAELERGIADGLAVGGAVSYDVLQSGEEQTYGRAHVAGFRRGVFGRADLATSSDGGFAARVLAQLRVGRTDVTAEHIELDNYLSDVFPRIVGPLLRSSRIRLDGLGPGWLGSPYVGIDAARHEGESGDAIYTVNGRASRQVDRTFVTLLLRSRFGEGSPAVETSDIQGSILASRFVRRTALRGEVQWRLEPDAEVTNVAISADRFLERIDALARLSVRHALSNETTTLTAGLNRYQGPFSWGGEVTLSDDGQWSAAALLGASILRDDRTGDVHTFARNYAYMGAATVRVFLDRNANGIYDAGSDEPIEGVEVFVDNASFDIASDENGVILVPGMASERYHTIRVSITTLADPLWVPAAPELRFHARPGRTMPIDLPVLITGEVVGTVYIARDGLTRAASGIELELVDSDGRVVAETVSAYDGFYELVRVPPGDYELRVDRDRRGRELVVPDPRPIRIETDGSILEGIDIILGELR